MDVYKYQIWTGVERQGRFIKPCKRGNVNPTNTLQDCNCPPFIMGTLPNGQYGMLETNFTGLFDPDRVSGLTFNTNDPNNPIPSFTEPVSPLGGYQLGDVVLMDHDAIVPYNPRAGCLNEQGPHCFVYFREDYNMTGDDYFTTPEGPAPWRSPTYPLDNPAYEPGVGISGPLSIYAGMGVGVGAGDGAPWICCDSEDILDIIAHNGPDHQIPLFLDQDFNDIGFYTPFDGGIFQKDLFSNFITVVEDGTTDTINLTNSTPFGLFAYTQGFQFEVNWGDNTTQQVQYPTIELTHQYQNPGNYTISIQMVAPWGITSMSQPITIPYYSGASLTVPNPNLTFTYNSPGGSVVTQNWMYSTFGPLDSGTNVFQYVSANYAPVPLTVTGITESQLTNFSTYSTQPSNSAFLPNGYFLNQLVPLGGEVEFGIGDFQTSLFGEIISASANFTAYTISDGGNMNNPVQMFDYSNGVTIFEVDTIGLNQYNLFTQSCDPLSLEDLDEDPEVCDFCLTAQTAFFFGSSFQVNVTTNRGIWGSGTGYQIGDLVRWAGCCWYAGGTVPPPLSVPPNDPQVFEGGTNPATPIGWWPCPGQTCEATNQYDPAEIFGCIDSTALNYDPNATIDDGSCIYDDVTVGSGWNANDPVDGGETGFTGGTTTSGSVSVGGTAACCDEAAINYDDTACADQYVINDGSLCEYLGGSGSNDVWMCDPNNVLKLRCEADSGGSIASGCAAVDSDLASGMSYLVGQLNDSTNCQNAVLTPDATMIDFHQNGGWIGPVQIPALDPTNSWGLAPNAQGENVAGGKGTGCVMVNKAWHPGTTSSSNGAPPAGFGLGFGTFPTTGIGQFGVPISSFDDGGTDLGCDWPNYCYSWEMATILMNPAGPLSSGPPSVQPLSITQGYVNSITANNVNPVVELINVYQSMGMPTTTTSAAACMIENNGCPSTIYNYNY